MRLITAAQYSRLLSLLQSYLGNCSGIDYLGWDFNPSHSLLGHMLWFIYIYLSHPKDKWKFVRAFGQTKSRVKCKGHF